MAHAAVMPFGSSAALFGLSHGIITQPQYSYLIAAVTGSAIVPTLIADGLFLPRHLPPPPAPRAAAAPVRRRCAKRDRPRLPYYSRRRRSR